VAQLLLANSQQQQVGLEFHGGEPLLLTDDWFQEAVGYARSLASRHHKVVQFPLVTNGTLLTEERLLRLHALGIVFCLSADGPPRINDELRGGGAAVERALRLFKRHGIPCGILTVLGRANYNRMGEVMDWFADVGADAFRYRPGRAGAAEPAGWQSLRAGGAGSRDPRSTGIRSSGRSD
jgi:uncharacterized protein